MRVVHDLDLDQRRTADDLDLGGLKRIEKRDRGCSSDHQFISHVGPAIAKNIASRACSLEGSDVVPPAG